MKNKLFCIMAMACLALFCSAVSGYPDDAAIEKKAAVKEAPVFSGTLDSVNAKDKTFAVKKFFITRTFNVAENCAVSLEDKKSASLADLRPGHPVDVSYQESGGVYVADKVLQKNLTFSGTISALDNTTHQVTVHNTWGNKAFALADDTKYVSRDKSSATLDDLRLGNKVEVIYEVENGAMKAVRLEQHSLHFSGVINAVDTTTRTVKARQLLSEKKFTLASDCKIFVDGKPGGHLADLLLGKSAEFDYDDVGGVYVVNRIGQQTTPVSNDAPGPVTSNAEGGRP